MASKELKVLDEQIVQHIYLIRDQKLMLDRDLAKLYGVETKALKRAVKRNSGRFPPDFMFELSQKEFENWRYQFGTSNLSDKMGLRHAPMAFTEQGVAMLSIVLNSKKAVDVNIQIIRVFTKMRQMLMDNTELRLEIEKVKRKLENHGKNIELVFDYLDELIKKYDKSEKKETPNPRKLIGYKTGK